MTGSPPPPATVPEVSDNESDGPQKSTVTPKDKTKGIPREYDIGDDVQLAQEINGVKKSEIFQVKDYQLVDGRWQYQLERDGKLHTEKQESGDAKEWFAEKELDIEG